MEGSNGIVRESSATTVIKTCRKKATGYTALQQREIHRIAFSILANPSYTMLKTPFLVDGPLYEMQKVEVDEPIFLANPEIISPDVDISRLTGELVAYWKSMWAVGHAPWDFELYLQKDGTVMMLDYDKYKKKVDSNFFIHPSFPRNFEELIVTV